MAEQVAFHHAAFVVTDLDRAIAFWEETFGATVELRLDGIDDAGVAAMQELSEIEMDLAMVSLGPVWVELLAYRRPRGSLEQPGSADLGCGHVALRVPDLAAALARLAERGLRAIAPPVSVDDGPAAGWKLAYFRDPDGNRIELIELPDPPVAR